MDKDNKMRVITLADLWSIFVQRLWIILLVAVLCVALVAGYYTLLVAPKYESTAIIYILRRDNESDYVYTQSDFSLAKDVVNDCNYVLKSQDVLEDVIQKLDLESSVSSLKHSIQTVNPENTRFLEISVISDTPESAKQIVDCLCDAGAKKIVESMGFNQVNRYSYGQIPTSPCNRPGIFTYAVLAMLAGMITYFLFAVRFFLDTNIRSEEDISRYLGLSMLAEIPNYQTGKRGGSKYRYRYSSKYRYQSRSKAPKEKGGKAK